MFDPSKLDLDLENNKNTENKKKKTENKSPETEKKTPQDIKKIEEKTENTTDERIEPIETNLNKDILGDLNQNKKEEENEEEKAKSIKSEEIEQKLENEKDIKENKIIFDINIISIETLISILINKEYDFFTAEPTEDFVKIEFRKDKKIEETRFIKFPIYTNILLKAKALTNLTIEETENTQEWSWEIVLKQKTYKVLSKVVPSNLWAKLFIKAGEIQKKVVKKEAKKTSISQMLTFLWVIAFVALVIGWSFIGFIVMNAKTVQDVQFFASLWINLNDINAFIWQAVRIIFSILVFIEILLLIIFLSKFALTKKEFKQKRIRFAILSSIILLISFSTASAWMIIDRKIQSLPNWQEMAMWDVQIYDNSKLKSESFDKKWSIINNNEATNLIWPVEIKFDLSVFKDKEERKGINVLKYVWDFGDWELVETAQPTIIKNFDKKWNYEVSLVVEETDMSGKVIEKVIENIPNINVTYNVDINEKILNSWGKLVNLDASSLSELGKIEWYFIENLEEPAFKWNNFIISKPIFEETVIGMYIRNNSKTDESIDKVFVISWEEETNIDWKIKYSRDVINDLKFDIWIDNIYNEFWNGYIEKYKWIIWDKEITKVWDINTPEESSKIKFEFDSYWTKKIKVIITNSAWEEKTIETSIEIPKKLKIANPLKIYNDWNLIENINYEENVNEYYINKIGIPTEIKLDARLVKASNPLYTLKEVNWDYDSNWDKDESTKLWKYSINTEWNHIITVEYVFEHRKISNDIIKIKEKIFIEAIKKEAIIDFDIKKESSYAPIVISLDASKSQVKNENIVKFIWDYWDGISEQRDSIVPWHKYNIAWDYEIKLTAVTESWKEYSTSKKLILKPKPQDAKITTSLKKAPKGQAIDFSSNQSEGQIIWYFWDFGDWNTSTEANPSNKYLKSDIYEVKLTLDFANKNVETDIVEIEIY